MVAIIANGIEIKVEEHGSKEATPLLLVRGLGSQLIHWPARMILGFVAQGYRVITFDNRDIGLSQKFEGAGRPDIEALIHDPNASLKVPYILPDMAKDAFGVLDALGIDKAHIFGISMGGMILQFMSLQQPDRMLSSTIVMSSSGAENLPMLSEEATKMLTATPDNPYDRDQVIAHTLISDRFFGSPGFPFKDEERALLIGQAFDRSNNPDGVARQLAAIRLSPEFASRLETITVPTLVIHGTDDALISPEHGRDIAARIPNAIYVEVEGMGHDLEGDIGEIMVEEVTEFINDLS